MTRLALLVTFLSLAAAPRAQALLLPDGATGAGAGVGTGLSDDVADVAVGVTATLSPRLDLQASYATADVRGGLTSFGIGAAVYLRAEGGERAALTVGVQRVTGDRFDPATVLAVGAAAGRQVPVGGAVLLVPTVNASVGAVVGGGSGLQTAVGVEALLVAGGSARVYGGPSATLTSESAAFARGLDAVAIGVTVGVVFGGR